jgi:hypothetical protein
LEGREGLAITWISSPTAAATRTSVSRVMLAFPASISDWYGCPLRVSLPTSACDSLTIFSRASRIAAPSVASNSLASAFASRSILLGRDRDFVRGNPVNRLGLQHLSPTTVSESHARITGGRHCAALRISARLCDHGRIRPIQRLREPLAFCLPSPATQNRLHPRPIGSKYLLYIRMCSRLCVDKPGSGSRFSVIRPARCSRFCVTGYGRSGDNFGACSLLCVGNPARHVANSAHHESGGPDKPFREERS